MDDLLYATYSRPQSGGNLPVFSGSKRHLKGGGFFGTLARFAFPLLKKLGKHALGAAARGGIEYLAGNKKFIPAMKDEVGREIANIASINKHRVPPRRKKRKRSTNF